MPPKYRASQTTKITFVTHTSSRDPPVETGLAPSCLHHLHSRQETRQPASRRESPLSLRRDGLQAMAKGASFANPEQNGEGKPDKSKDREDPHAKPVSSRVVQTGAGVVIGLT